MAELRYGSWYIGADEEEAREDTEKLQERLNAMANEGWTLQHFSIADASGRRWVVHGYIWAPGIRKTPKLAGRASMAPMK